ncbi:MAG: TonB-dependent receptor [Cytophagales bacterium]|nr:TonB-dependent receptor [Cytophagales bacterium]
MKIASFAISLLLTAHFVLSQPKYTISGTLKDKKNGEDVIGATISVKETQAATTTNAYGFFSITLPEGKYTINVSYLGYKTYTNEIDLNANQKLNIEIEEEKIELTEVEVTSERPDANVKSIEMSINKLEMGQIKKMPALLGEVDVIRSIQLLPGVSSVGEGSSGFNVRGGSIDHNLVLLDEAPVYNSSHLFGFFSVFNPDAVKDVKLYKGGIPAQYGGRLASILDVRMKEGNNKRFAAQGGIGLIFSRLTFEGPIKKNKGSFIVAGRRSYADVLAAPALASNPDLDGFKLYFYDFTMKANYNIGTKDKIFASGYLGRDVFGVASFGFDWGNSTFTTRWNHVFNDRLFMNVTGFYSNYDYALGAETNSGGDKFSWKSNIINYSVKPELTYFLNSKNTIQFGGQTILYDFVPGTLEIINSGNRTTLKLDSKYALEHAVYISNEQKIIPRLSMQYGLRLSAFQYIGPGIKRTYGPEPYKNETRYPVAEPEKVESLQSIASYINPEPRLNLKFELTEYSSLKASYMRTSQYIHLISNTAASIPLDVFTPSTNNIKPQISDQVAIGYFRNFGSNTDYETSVELFYKDMKNQIDYVDGADLLLNPNLEGVLLSGKGRAYGAEFMVKKNKGKLNGWISYTISRSERKVDGISNDAWYPNRFDRTHNLNIVVSYQLSKRVSVSSNAQYGTGTPVNLYNMGYAYAGQYVGHNPTNARNNIRIPEYFRIDASVSIKSKRKKYDEAEIPANFFKAIKYRYEWELVFSVYNVLNARNPFAIFPRYKESLSNQVGVNYQATNLDREMAKFSLFATIIPGITYNFKF